MAEGRSGCPGLSEFYVAGIDDDPEAATATLAAERNFSGEAGAEELQDILAMRARCGGGSAGRACARGFGRVQVLLIGRHFVHRRGLTKG